MSNVRQLMRARSLVLVVALACPVVPALAQSQAVHVVRGGQSIAVSQGIEIATKLVALAESSSVNSTEFAVSGETWANTLASESFVQASFPKPRSLLLAAPAGQARRLYQVRSLLLPLPVGHWPAHLLVEADGKVISLTKFAPSALRRLISEPELQLSTVEPYSSLTSTQHTR